MQTITLQNGLKMPMEGFGVFQVRDKEECKRSVLDAIRAGYRLIDTAASYGNEDAVGEAVREAIAEGLCTREELFITSKMWVQDMQSYETAEAAIDASLEKIGLQYLDLYLLHQAMKDYFSAWRAMEDAYRVGKLKAIGVSNFYPHVLTNFCETVEICPMVNQVELHPYFTQEAALETMAHYQIVPEGPRWAAAGIGPLRMKCWEKSLKATEKPSVRSFCVGIFSGAWSLFRNPPIRSGSKRISISGILPSRTEKCGRSRLWIRDIPARRSSTLTRSLSACAILEKFTIKRRLRR